ncbi:MAG: hypothetical protein J6Y20_12720 [Lachnospiraceae bacterium]|nr:hypothetical protein [Lachnospiraceae bacterium]
MKIRIVAAVCAVVLLCTACGKKTNSSNVTLMEMTNYEHVVSAATLPDKEEEKQLIRDTDGYYVVNDVVYVTSNTLNIRRLPGTDEEVVDTVSYGTALARTGIGDNGWDRISYENMPAYISNSHITTLTIHEDRGGDFYSSAMLSVVDTSRQMYSYDSMCEDLTELRKLYGDRMRLNCIGSTKDKRSIFEIVIGNPEKAKKHIFFCAGICGAEYMSTLVCMKQAEYCLCYYDTGNYNGFAYNELCDYVAIHVIPMLNPDGVMISEEHLGCVENTNIISDLKKWYERDSRQGGTSLDMDNYLMFYYANANGVDLRRNFDDQWNQIVTEAEEPSSKDYRGKEPASEPETRALLAQMTGCEPDLVIAYHTTGSKIVCRYGQEEQVLSDALKYAEKLADVMSYGVENEKTGSAGYGSYEGYCNRVKDIPALGVYLGNGSTPLSLNEFNAIWNACRDSWAVLQIAVINN